MCVSLCVRTRENVNVCEMKCARSLSLSLSFSLFQIIKKLIERKQAQIRKVYPGLSCFKEGVRQIPIESIPGIRTSFNSYSKFILSLYCLRANIQRMCNALLD